MEKTVELRIGVIPGIHRMSVCGRRRTKSEIVHAESGVEIYKGKGSGRTKSPKEVGTADVACYHRGSSLASLR